MNKNNKSILVFNSVEYVYSKDLNYTLNEINLQHSRFCYAITKIAYEKISRLYEKAKHLRFNYISGVIRHHFYGRLIDNILKDGKILVKYNYSPKLHITQNKNGVLIPIKDFSDCLKNKIY